MAQLAPPPPPPSTLKVSEDDSLRRVHLRLWQIFMSALTAGITAWLASFGPIPAILALMVAKHLLVAILVAGMKTTCGPRL